METTSKFMYYLPVEYRKVECYFEECAKKGLILKQWKYKKAIFFKSEPRDIQYCIDFSKNKTSEYLEMCAFYGWDFVCEYNEFIVFSHEGGHISSLQSDDEMAIIFAENGVFKSISRKYRNKAIGFFVLFLICIISSMMRNQFSSLKMMDYIFLITFLLNSVYSVFILSQLNSLKKSKEYLLKDNKARFKYLLFPFELIGLPLLVFYFLNFKGYDIFILFLIIIISVIVTLIIYIRE